MLTTPLIEQILAALPGKTVGVLGDLFLDRYLDIDAALTEPSVETGLDAYQVTRVRSYPGALGTIFNNLAALGVGRIYPIAVVGDDGEGYELKQALKRMPSVHLGGVVTWEGRRTPTYTKPMLTEAGKPPRELNRLDIKNRTPTPPAAERMVIELLEEAWPQFDALIVLDQVSEEDCGVVTKRVRERLAELGEREPERFVLADSREQIRQFRAVHVKPNERECFVQGGSPAGDDLNLGPYLMAAGCGRAVFCTAGERGIFLYRIGSDQKLSEVRVPGFPAAGPTDPVGAGDSCSAGIACAVSGGATLEQAAAFGNLVASITVQQIGTTGTASPEQVRQRWRDVCKLSTALAPAPPAQ